MAKWAIIGAGTICKDFATVIVREGGLLVACGAREQDRAQKLLNNVGAPSTSRAYGSYEEAVNDSNVTICYVGVIHPHHSKVAMLAISAGKHVLCEKPLTMSFAQSQKLVQAAHSSNCFLQEGYWTRFFPAAQYVIKLIRSGKYGKVSNITAEFGFPMQSQERMIKKELGGGIHLDLGVYFLQWCSWIMERKPIEDVFACGKLNDEGVDSSYSVILSFDSKTKACFSASSFGFMANELRISFEGGITVLRVPQFWCPTKVVIENPGSSETKEFEQETTLTLPNTGGFRHEIKHVEGCLSETKLESSVIPLQESLEIAQLSERILRQIGYAST